MQASPISRVLHSNGITVDWLVFSEHAHLIERNPFVSNLIRAPRKTLFEVIKFFFQIRKSRYDAVLIFHRHWIFSTFFWLAGIKIRIGWVETSKLFVNYPIKFTLSQSVYALHLNALLFLNIDVPDSSSGWKSVYKIPDSIQNPVQSTFKSKYWVLAPGGGRNRYSTMATKLWPYYDELAQKIRLHFPEDGIVFVGDHDDAKLIAPFKSLSDSKTLSIAGKASVDELAAMIRDAAFFIGNDSFALHLAAAFDCQIVGIFGPTDAQWLIPQIPNATAIFHHVPCSPCYDPVHHRTSLAFNCPYSNRCMTDLEPQQVLDICLGGD